MKTFLMVLLATCCGLVRAPGVEPDAAARQLADAVVRASGGANWAQVKSIRFTFHVDQDGKPLLSAAHDWDVRAGTDRVTWGGKTVTVNVWRPGTDADTKAAYQRWVNDSYWLLMPLKLADPGVTVEYGGEQEIGGEKFEVLHLSFGKVGLTSGDQYNLYIDPATHLVSRWDYLPNAKMKVTGTWEDYRDFGGLKLSTDHRFGGKRIWFSGVAVEAE